MAARHTDLTQGSIGRHILRMTPPMIGAFIAMMAFNLADTWFVSRLGTVPLAAMGFTFPVVLFLHSIAMGLGLGTSAAVSRSIGSGDGHRVRSLATYSLVLTFGVFLALSAGTYLLMPRLFRLLGAGPETLPLTTEYMQIWLLFAPLGALPMIGNNSIRATGDTLRPSLIMMLAALLNIILDPILIFGWGPFPAMGMRGAALATGIARMLTLAASLWVLGARCQMLSLRWPGRRTLFAAWAAILAVALPASATNLLMPVTAGVITHLIATFGEHAVAATAAGQRVEYFAYTVPIAMGTVLVPIIGQNWGAGRLDRVQAAWRATARYGIIYGVVCVALAYPAGPSIARWFSEDPAVIRLITVYIRTMLAGAVLLHVAVHTGFALNAIQRPLQASLLTAVRLLGLVIPLAWLGGRLFGMRGVYGGMAAAYALCGLIAIAWWRLVLRRTRAPASEHLPPVLPEPAA